MISAPPIPKWLLLARDTPLLQHETSQAQRFPPIVVIQARRFLSIFRVSIYFEQPPSRCEALDIMRVYWQFGLTTGYQISNDFACDRAELKTVIRVAETVKNRFMLI